MSISKVAALELFAFQELLEVVPEHVLHIDVMMSLMSLQFESQCVPLENLWWDLAAGEADVVCSYTGEELSFLLTILPVLELPVLTIDKYCDDTLPA